METHCTGYTTWKAICDGFWQYFETRIEVMTTTQEEAAICCQLATTGIAMYRLLVMS